MYTVYCRQILQCWKKDRGDLLR